MPEHQVLDLTPEHYISPAASTFPAFPNPLFHDQSGMESCDWHLERPNWSCHSQKSTYDACTMCTTTRGPIASKKEPSAEATPKPLVKANNKDQRNWNRALGSLLLNYNKKP